MNAKQSTLILAAAAALLLAGCSPSATPTAPGPVETDGGTTCVLDGMLLADHPGPKAQIHFADQDTPDFFCDTVEMFHVYLEPEQVRAVRGVFVQDMGATSWDEPRDHWIDAKSAFFVVGSSRRGSMGPTIASFSSGAAARQFAEQHGGKVLPFSAITADMVRLDGGVLHDVHM